MRFRKFSLRRLRRRPIPLDVSTIGLIGADDAGLMFSDDAGWIA